MTFSQNRIAIKQAPNTWELTRFATIGKFSIIGIAGKLYQHFLQNYNHGKLIIISYSDLCWGEGKLYEKLGFKFERYTTPGYFYYNYRANFRQHRYTFRKSELSKILENFDSLKSEEENMVSNGYLKIYNAGNAKYIHSF
jgi:hypothetical protein